MDEIKNNHGSTADPIEDVFKSYPLESVPVSLYANVMREVQKSPLQPYQVVRPFRLVSWLDVAISLFLSVMFGMIMLMGKIIPPEMIPSLKWAVRMIGHPLVIIPLVIGLIMAGAGLIIASNLINSQRKFI
jgi:hypothetical protein